MNVQDARGYSTMGRDRMRVLLRAVADVYANNIPGCIVEVGVWRGGGMM